MKLRPTLLITALALASTTASAQFNQTVFFGDSLSDTGRLQAQINGNFLIALFAGSVEPSFTTNPDSTWATHFANTYGLKAEPHLNTEKDSQAEPNDKEKVVITNTNFAVGGAKAATPVREALGMVRIDSVKKQVEDYLKLAKQADPNTLYAVWVGANDLIGASENTNATDIEKLTMIQNAAKAQVASIEELQKAGAKHFLVPNLPDVGLTPRAQQDKAFADQATQAAQIYNTTLFNALNEKGINVIPANSFALLQEAVNNPEGFGFQNVNTAACNNLGMFSSLGCKESDWKTPDANKTYIFADDIHPTGRTHQILAQYYRSIIDAPSTIGIFNNRLLNQGHWNNQRLQQRLTNLSPKQNAWWIEGDVQHYKTDLTESDQAYPNVRLGAHIAKEKSHTGLYVQYSDQTQQLNANNQVQADIKQYGLGLYHRYQNGNVQLNLLGGVDQVDLTTARQVAWDGPAREHQGNATGQRLHASARLGYEIPHEKLTVTPYLGANVQSLKMNDLIENQAHLSTAMKYHGQTYKSLQAEAGVNVAYNVSNATQVYGGLGVTHEFEDEATQVTASLTSMPQYKRGFTTAIPNNAAKETQYNVHFGVKTQLHHNVTLNAGLAAQGDAKDTQNLGGFIGLQTRF